ncbi:hypothetical protein NEUTE1DRAFT_35265 [Neurospora tetrasperma FGSC 2508]|uniref:Uncharacterized protein n=1 Tax=Neurospora tetrasperma (strain FGSC 2508 / ATCC MYA-4615 / P0657) TaxID=510951 RepID=F8MCV7_NEUT8|nr:uncharacterized protein NEUTE1DRAFT_35265 [Neurospora tetrasperma FGSC 2508]EGO61355.1 hypothetical protein NEUTE1DRAFT_35265 [Neurospora tetrasperma FGSC 2508]EGZ74622.1 hypothetical protein NEUTE2DRAFT_57178 [Neurospora tetrasperma FGSC 2509]
MKEIRTVFHWWELLPLYMRSLDSLIRRGTLPGPTSLSRTTSTSIAALLDVLWLAWRDLSLTHGFPGRLCLDLLRQSEVSPVRCLQDQERLPVFVGMIPQSAQNTCLHQLVVNGHTGTLEATAKPVSSALKFKEVIELRVVYMTEFPHQVDFGRCVEVKNDIPAMNSIPQGLWIEVIRQFVGVISGETKFRMDRLSAVVDDSVGATSSIIESLKVLAVLGSVTRWRCFRPFDKTLKTMYPESS